MSDKFVKTTKTGLGSRLMGSIKGVFVGILLFLVSFGVLYWNEGRVDVSEVAKNAVEISVDQLASDMEGKFVHVMGDVVSEEQIGDGLYLLPGNYLAVERTVEMYAWVEHTSSTTEDEWGGSQTTETTYTYSKEWTGSPASSSSFEEPSGHENPGKTIENYSGRVNTAKVGVYDLDMGKLSLSGFESLSLNDEVIDSAKLGAASVEKSDGVETDVDVSDDEFSYEWTVSTTETEGEGEVVKTGGPEVTGGYIFQGEGSLTSPEVGDHRISYSVLRSGTEGTVFGELNGTKLVTYVDEDTETSLYRMFNGTRDEALSTMHGEYKFMLWLFRGIGFLMMWFGLSALFGPVVVFLHIVPALGSLSKSLVSFVTFIVAAILSAVTIFVSMILHNVIALVIIVIAVLAITLYIVKGKLKKPKVVKA